VSNDQFWELCHKHFVGPLNGLSSDFYAWIRLKSLGVDDLSEGLFLKLLQGYSKSKRQGKNLETLNRRRREEFGPGKYWAPTPAGQYLNRNFVKGWGGVNPKNP